MHVALSKRSIDSEETEQATRGYLAGSRWTERGWTFQERHFLRRGPLIFTEKQVCWQMSSRLTVRGWLLGATCRCPPEEDIQGHCLGLGARSRIWKNLNLDSFRGASTQGEPREPVSPPGLPREKGKCRSPSWSWVGWVERGNYYLWAVASSASTTDTRWVGLSHTGPQKGEPRIVARRRSVNGRGRNQPAFTWREKKRARTEYCNCKIYYRRLYFSEALREPCLLALLEQHRNSSSFSTRFNKPLRREARLNS